MPRADRDDGTAGRSSVPILTIAFPTRDRAKSLDRVLSNITEIVISEGLDSEVQVLVSDNNSRDATAEIISGFTGRYPFVAVVSSDRDLSFDRNVLNCFQFATTKFLWICNDHSGFIAENVARVVQFVRERGAANCFFYVPEVGNLRIARDLCSRSRYGLAFVSTLINCNIFDRVSVLHYYRSFMPQFEGSWLVFLMANLEMLYSSKGAVFLIPYETVIYGQFADAAKQRNSWSSDWDTYLRVGSVGSEILDSAIRRFGLSKSETRVVFRNRGWGASAVASYRSLRLSNLHKRSDAQTARRICQHPSYSFIERVLIWVFVRGPAPLVPIAGCVAVALRIVSRIRQRVRLIDGTVG